MDHTYSSHVIEVEEIFFVSIFLIKIESMSRCDNHKNQKDLINKTVIMKKILVNHHTTPHSTHYKIIKILIWMN